METAVVAIGRHWVDVVNLMAEAAGAELET